MEELKFENSIILYKIIPAAIYLLGVNSGKTKWEIVKCEVFSMKTRICFGYEGFSAGIYWCNVIDVVLVSLLTSDKFSMFWYFHCGI